MKRLLVLSALMVLLLPGRSTAANSAAAIDTGTGMPLENSLAADTKGNGKKEEEAKIPGQTIQRSTAGYLGLEVVAGTFKLSFYDAKKKPVPADATWGVIRWLVNYDKSGEQRVMLGVSGDGLSLVCPRAIRPPYTFRLYLLLFKDQGPDAKPVETYTVDFSG